MAKKTPEINATSTADIAFLLLIFFLMSTTMDVDSGMYRKLPPFQPDNTEAPKIIQRNVLSVLVNRNNDLSVGGEIIHISALRDKAKEFILNPANSADLPEKTVKEIPLLGNVEVSKGIISLQSDKGTSYETYITVQDELAAAYTEARDQKSNAKWQKKFADLKPNQQDAIKELIPMAISEAEPKNIGGKK